MKQYFLLACFVFYFSLSFSQPAFNWALSNGGSGTDEGEKILATPSGSVYVLGVFSATVDMDPGPGISNFTSNGSFDICLKKLDASGNLLWAKTFGGSTTDIGSDILLDGTGNIYISGSFAVSVDFDPGAGTNTVSSFSGSTDGFILKLDASGNFVWVKQIGGNAADGITGISLDASGNIYACGGFSTTSDFDPGAGTSNLSSAGAYDIFILKLNSSGNFVWAKGFGSSSNDSANEVDLDNSGNVWATGYFQGTVDFDPGAATVNLTSAGVEDVFVLKLDGLGNYVWAGRMGGSGLDSGSKLKLNASAEVVILGDFNNVADFDPGAGTSNQTSVGARDVFLAKLNSAGVFQWAVSFGSTGNEEGYGLDMDGAGNIFITGYFFLSADFDPSPGGTYNLSSVGQADIFISKFSGAGNFVWAQRYGGTTNDYGVSIDALSSDSIYATGSFNSTVDFDPGPTTFNLTTNGGLDEFILKLSVCSIPSTPNNISGNSTVCDGTSNSYSINAVPGATSYTWTLPAGWTGTSTTNTINATAGSSGGNITVVANNACGSSSSQTMGVTVITVPAQPQNLLVPSPLCINTTVNFSVLPVAGATSYTWNLPPGWTGSSITDTIAVFMGSMGGTLTVTADNSCGASLPLTANIFVLPVPAQPGTISGPDTVCAGTVNTYSISSVPGAATYTWTFPAGWTGSSNTSSITLTAGTAGGNISVTADNACGSSPVQSMLVSVIQVPATPGSISGNTSVCDGSTNTYSVVAVPDANSYTWTLPGGWTGSSSGSSINATAGSTGGNILVTANNSCGNSGSSSLTVTSAVQPTAGFTSSPASLIVTFTDQSTGATGWNWNFGDGNSSITQNPVHTYSLPGTYQVCLAVSNGSCADSTCTPVNVTTTGLNAQAGLTILVFPNPSNGIFWVETSNSVTAAVKDQLGKTVRTLIMNPGINELDLSNLGAGVYYLSLMGGNETGVSRLVKFD